MSVNFYQIYHYLYRFRPLLHMNSSSPTSPLALANSSDGSFDHHGNVPTTTHTFQPRELPLLDGIRPYNNSQPDSTRHNPYGDALKFGVGGNGNSQVATYEPKLCSQLSKDNPAGLLPLGQSSHLSDQPEIDPPMPSYP